MKSQLVRDFSFLYLPDKILSFADMIPELPGQTGMDYLRMRKK